MQDYVPFMLTAVQWSQDLEEPLNKPASTINQLKHFRECYNGKIAQGYDQETNIARGELIYILLYGKKTI